MKRIGLAWTLAALSALTACDDEAIAECKGGDMAGPAPSCAEVCAHLFEITCRVASSVEQCQLVCEGSGAPTDFPEVLRCYQAADDCSAVDSCSRGCGPDASPVPFKPVTIGPDAADDQDGG